MLALEQGDDIVVIDAGLMFPDEEMLGIDLVIPDISYLKQNKGKARAVILTHAHEDHMGALPYVLRDFPDVPLYGTKLTLGLMRTKLREHKLADKVDAREFAPGTPFRIGAFECDSYAVCHSIPDAVGITLETRHGTVVHSGDWKFDHTPVDGRQTDFAKLSSIAAKGVLLLLSDSTRSWRARLVASSRRRSRRTSRASSRSSRSPQCGAGARRSSGARWRTTRGPLGSSGTSRFRRAASSIQRTSTSSPTPSSASSPPAVRASPRAHSRAWRSVITATSSSRKATPSSCPRRRSPATR